MQCHGFVLAHLSAFACDSIPKGWYLIVQSYLFLCDWEEGGLDQQSEQNNGPAITIGHMHLVQPTLSRMQKSLDMRVHV